MSSDGPKSTFFRRPWFVGALLIVVALSIRVIVSGQSAASRGDDALAKGDALGAALAYREAISWVFPVAPWRDAAAEKLWTMAEATERAGKWADAVQAYSLLRAGFLGGRSVFGVDDAWREKIDAKLAPLMARWEAEAARSEGRSLPGDLKVRTDHYAQILARDTLPSRAWGLLAILGFLIWVVAAWRATGLEGKPRLTTLAVSGLGLTLFLVGVGLA